MQKQSDLMLLYRFYAVIRFIWTHFRRRGNKRNKDKVLWENQGGYRLTKSGSIKSFSSHSLHQTTSVLLPHDIFIYFLLLRMYAIFNSNGRGQYTHCIWLFVIYLSIFYLCQWNKLLYHFCSCHGHTEVHYSKIENHQLRRQLQIAVHAHENGSQPFCLNWAQRGLQRNHLLSQSAFRCTKLFLQTNSSRDAGIN